MMDRRLESDRRTATFGCMVTKWLALYMVIGHLAHGVGCNRAYYRQQADRDAYCLIKEKANHPHWSLPRYSIDLDPRSRMFDPFSPDCPPMPTDDPTAHQLMHRIDGKKGYRHWHCNGDTSSVENPNWLAGLPWGPDNVVALDVDTAVRLSLIHSDDFQEELEELYLSALDVSFERFRFDSQFFGGSSLFYTADGKVRGGGESRSELEASTFLGGRGIRMQRMFSAGGELVVGLANSLVWQFAGPNTQDARTLLDFTLVQPLLRAGGRDRVLERLTIAERTLLANVRQMERFRRGFYLEVVAGRDAGPGPSRRGGFFGGAGLQGFTGVGGGGFGRVGGFSGGGGVAGGAGAAGAGGFLGLVQDQLDLRIQEANIVSLRNSLSQLDAFFRAGRIDYFQVELARQALLNAQSQWLNAKAAYQSSLDNFKTDLGLPPQLPVRVVDNLLEDFNLIDPSIVPVQNELTSLQEQVGQAIDRSLGPETIGSADGLIQWSPTLATAASQLADTLNRLHEIRQEVLEDNLPRARRDVERLRWAIPQRIEQLRGLSEKLSGGVNLASGAYDVGSNSSDARLHLDLVDADRLSNLPQKLANTINTIESQFDDLQTEVNEIQEDIETLSSEGPTLGGAMLQKRLQAGVFARVPDLLQRVSAHLLELSLAQARARTESITLSKVDVNALSALEIARENRRDWMNARATLVDTWRLIQFNANDLESQLDIVFSGDIGNVDKPFHLRGTTGRLRAGLEFDAPITRLSERNTYRQALIEYQQARRNYYQFVDRITQGLRTIVRTVDLNQLNFELRRSAVEVAIAQVELARLRLEQPPRPNEEAVLGATTARDLVNALSDLLNVQSDFLSVWFNYEVLRRSLDFDLGTMQLDPEGIWIDPGPINIATFMTTSELDDRESIEPPIPNELNAPDRVKPVPMPVENSRGPFQTPSHIIRTNATVQQPELVPVARPIPSHLPPIARSE